MEEANFLIAISLGEIIMIKSGLDQIKNRYENINILPYYKAVFNEEERCFVKNICSLFFSEKPYTLLEGEISNKLEYPTQREGSVVDLVTGICLDNILYMGTMYKYGISMIEPNFSDILCKGKSLKVSRNYIVINTKVRLLHINILKNILADLKLTFAKLNKKYDIVLMGERHNQKEYGSQSHDIYCAYNYLNEILPPGYIDLTFNGFSTIEKIQEDCKIMNEAHAVISLGAGGSFMLASCVANKLLAIVSPGNPNISKIETIYGNSKRTYVTYDNSLFFRKLQTL